MKKEIPDMKGTLDLKTSIRSSDSDEIITEGTLNMKLDELKTDKTVKDISASFDYDVALDLDAGNLSISKADVTLQDIPMSLKGAIRNFKDSPDLDLSISVPTVNAGDMQGLISPFLDTEGMKIAGEIAADIKLSGRVKEPGELAAEGLLKLSSLSITKDQLNAVVDGNIRFDKKILKIDMNGKSGRNMASIKGTVKDYSGTPEINMDIYSKKLFMDELIPVDAKEGTSATENTPASAGIKEEAKPLDLKLTANGKVNVDSAAYKGLEMTNFNMNYEFKKNKLEIEKMSAEAGKGRLDIVSTIDMSKPGYYYSVSSNLDSLHADEVVNALFPKAKNTVFGILSFNMNMNGSGTLPENIKRNLKADGNFNIKDGRITDNPLTDKFSLFLGVDDLKTIDFNRSEGSVTVRNGVAKLKSIFSSDDISMNPGGNIGLDETLDLAFDLSLSPELTDKASRNSNVAQYIKNDEGWGQIPVLVAGNFSKPTYKVDVAKAGKRVIKKRAIELIEDILDDGKSDEVPAEGVPEEDTGQPDIQKPLEDLLKGIFN
jgi:AsmA protein